MLNRNLNKRICSLHLKLLQAKFVPIESDTPLICAVNEQTNALKNSQRKKSKHSTFYCSRSHKSLYRKDRTNCNTYQVTPAVREENPPNTLEYLDVNSTEVYQTMREKSRQERATTKQPRFNYQIEKQKRMIEYLQKQNNILHKQVVKICTNMRNKNGKRVKNIGDIRVFHKDPSSLENSKIFLCDDLSTLVPDEASSQNNHQSQFAHEAKEMKGMKKKPKLLKKASETGTFLNQTNFLFKTKNSNSSYEVSSKNKQYQYQRKVVLNQFQSLYEKIQKHKSGMTTFRHKDSIIMDKREMTEEFIRKIPKSLSKKLQHFFGSKQMRVSELVKNLR